MVPLFTALVGRPFVGLPWPFSILTLSPEEGYLAFSHFSVDLGEQQTRGAETIEESVGSSPDTCLNYLMMVVTTG